MSYIGRGISNLSDRTVLDSITTSATATYNLLLNTVAYVPSSAESLTVSLNGVIQAPQSSYTVSGSTIVFDSALTGTDVIDFILAERAITLTTIGSGTVTTSNIVDANVTTAKIADNAVTSDKLASGLALGKIGQVVQTSLTDNNQTLNTTTFTDLTSLTVSITPTATSSKILITSAIQVYLDDSTGARAYLRLLRGTTERQVLAGMIDNGQSTQGVNYVFSFLDSPSSSAEQVYKIQGKSTNSSLDIRFVYNSADSISTTTTLTAMEVLA